MAVNTKYGNKALNLERLKQAGFKVPPFFVAEAGLSAEVLNKKVLTELPGVEYFAVRSSSCSEDSAEKSYAGHFYSAVGVSATSLYEEYTKVLDSYNESEGGVIVQEFIPTSVSGVLFTNSRLSRFVINANFGICKTVVEGGKCDEYYLNGAGKIEHHEIAERKACLHFSKGNFRETLESKTSLNERQLKRLITIGQKIESHFDQPQDIEWGFKKEQVYILQTRPVTRELPYARQKTNYDSANIAESYSGLVLPLTQTFARHIYRVVYKNLLRASGVPKARLEKNREVFDNMLGWFYGRLYYNMNNWYRMMSFLPGYKRNKVNLEQMITSNVRAEVDRNIKPGKALRALYPLVVIGKLLFFGSRQRRFARKTKAEFQKFQKLNIDKLSWDDCIALYKKADRTLISRWHIPVENDFMVMTFFGLLLKRFSGTDLHQAIQFESKTGSQIKQLIHLRNKFSKDPETRIAFEQGDFELFSRRLHQLPEQKELLTAYLREFGGRFASELKLESPDLEEDPQSLFDLLSIAGQYETGSDKNSVSLAKFGPIDKYLINRFKKYAAWREEMRLLRSNGFSVIRRIFLRMGNILVSEERLKETSDIFYLDLEDLLLGTENLNQKVEYQKKLYKKYKGLKPAGHFAIEEGEMPPEESATSQEGNILEGRPCMSGKVSGKVSIFKVFELSKTTRVDILVAQHTDPGWTPLIGLCKGMIIEHGGILSHAAIVSRELGIPTVIGVKGATDLLRNGQKVELDGDTGTIRLCNES